ncbi:hypothetical protein IU405_04935 [Polaribacter sp. BAL334]|uniref:hypothetical protein n=1 Tax=Polaribacter sp. BAL334 TaxID=1708178 RepID=UPI0018D21F40|nr:hypothetical protein [Polaribacter sp. BAL334]MBG7611591.1 hypothetical protein [Polaribacter sp. BAL334]
MKKSSLLVFAIIASLLFSSCSSNEEGIINTDVNAKLLKNFTVKRDASGAYSLDFNVTENTKVDKVANQNLNSNEFYLYSSENNSTTKIAEQLLIDNNQLKVGFIDTNSESKKASVTVYDDDITLAKGDLSSKLKSYSITKNDDGLYDVVFEVKNNVAVKYAFNEKEDAFEIHLTNGKSADANFSTTLEKKEGVPLKIVFVNYVGNTNAKSESTDLTPIRKPVIIIDED